MFSNSVNRPYETYNWLCLFLQNWSSDGAASTFSAPVPTTSSAVDKVHLEQTDAGGTVVHLEQSDAGGMPAATPEPTTRSVVDIMVTQPSDGSHSAAVLSFSSMVDIPHRER